MPHLSAGDILLVDRFDCSYFTEAMLAEHGVHILTRQRHRRRTDFRQGHRPGHRNQLVSRQRPQRPGWMDQATYARMPEQLSLRQTEVAGRVRVTHHPYRRAQRGATRSGWAVPTVLAGGSRFRSIIAVTGMDILRAKSPSMIAKEIAVHLLIYNMVRGLMARAAAGAEDRTRPELQGHTATVVVVAATSALSRRPACPDHECAPARVNQHDAITDSARTYRAASDRTTTEKPCPAESASPCRARCNHPCRSGLRLRYVP